MRRMRGITALALVLGVFAALLAGPPASAAPQHVGVTSFDNTKIWISIYKPSTASATAKAPVILHSHGWGGSRTKADNAFGSWLSAGYGVVSIDQRGHGETGGTAYVQNPDVEAKDIAAVIDFVAGLDWVRKDLDAEGNEIANDPVLAAIGGSYGGGYQLMSALTEVFTRGKTRFNALAPEITWNDLPNSLAPQDIPRMLWTTLLYAAGATRVPDYVHQSYALGVATATFPNGEIPGTYNLKERFYMNSPAWFAENGIQLDIPVLFRQGTSDNLFPLNEAYRNFQDVLTPAARGRSLLIGYNGGHALPSAVPVGVSTGSDACSGGFEAMTRSFFAEAFAGRNPSALQPTPFAITTAGGGCVRVDSLEPTTTKQLGAVVSSTAAGAPIHYELASGPLTVAGIAEISGGLTTFVPEARAFFALAVGETAATAQILQHNVMPIRQRLPVLDQAITLELAGVAAEIPAGQNLYLTVSAASDMFAGTGRTPGAVVLTGAEIRLPLH